MPIQGVRLNADHSQVLCTVLVDEVPVVAAMVVLASVLCIPAGTWQACAHTCAVSLLCLTLPCVLATAGLPCKPCPCKMCWEDVQHNILGVSCIPAACCPVHASNSAARRGSCNLARFWLAHSGGATCHTALMQPAAYITCCAGMRCHTYPCRAVTRRLLHACAPSIISHKGTVHAQPLCCCCQDWVCCSCSTEAAHGVHGPQIQSCIPVIHILESWLRCICHCWEVAPPMTYPAGRC